MKSSEEICLLGQAKRNMNELTRALISKVGKGTPYYETRMNVREIHPRTFTIE